MLKITQLSTVTQFNHYITVLANLWARIIRLKNQNFRHSPPINNDWYLREATEFTSGEGPGIFVRGCEYFDKPPPLPEAKILGGPPSINFQLEK